MILRLCVFTSRREIQHLFVNSVMYFWINKQFVLERALWLLTAARHFNNRVQLFLWYILLNKQLIPLGIIKYYRYRIEFNNVVHHMSTYWLWLTMHHKYRRIPYMYKKYNNLLKLILYVSFLKMRIYLSFSVLSKSTFIQWHAGSIKCRFISLDPQ